MKSVHSKPTNCSASYAVRFERIGKDFAQSKPTIYSVFCAAGASPRPTLDCNLRGAVREDWERFRTE